MEGPHTHALADALADALTGRPVDRIDTPTGRWQANVLLHNCVGQVIQRTRAHGKWLLLDFSHGVTWASELLGKSTWAVSTAAAGESAAADLLALTLRDGTRATLIGHPAFLTLTTEHLFTHADLKELGPDPMTSADYAIEFPQRLRRAAARTVGAALTDQHIVAGLGNPLKCEVLFAAGLGGGARVASLLASQVDRLVDITAGLYRDVYSAARRNTPFDYAVYDREGQPCPRCGGDIAVDRTSGNAYPTWFCPLCQKPAEVRTLFTAG